VQVPHPPDLVSVVIPTLDEEAWLPGCLDALAAQPGPFEVIIADGGSRDRTVALARTHDLAPTVVAAVPGRGTQLNAGARIASGGALVFLHADTRLPPGALDLVRRACADGAPGGNFDVAWDGGGLFPRLLRLVARAERRLGVFYGDTVIWVRRDVFRALGGYPPIPLMEDYVLARRLVRTRADRQLPGPVVTSSRRWKRHGLPLTITRWVVIRWAFLAGVPARLLARLYPHAR
jgi:rSAM/selenodomain-associated transferase 2